MSNADKMQPAVPVGSVVNSPHVGNQRILDRRLPTASSGVPLRT